MIKLSQISILKYFKIISFSFIVFTLTFCNKPYNREQIEYMNFQCTHVDSIWEFVNHYKLVKEFAETAVNEMNRLYANPELQDSANKLLNLIDEYTLSHPDPTILSYYYAMKCRYAIEDSDPALIQKLHEKWQSYEPFASSNNIISHSLDMGYYYYRYYQFDSAIISFNKALDVSENNNDTFFRKVILINLGATFYKVNMYKSSSECFSKALTLQEQTINDRLNPDRYDQLIMLNNNLMVSLSQESRFEEVFKIFNDYKYLLKQKEVAEDHKTLFKLNYITALTNTRQYTKAKPILSTIQPPSPEDYNYSYYNKVKMQLWFNQENYDSFTSTYETILPFIYANQPASIDEHFINLSEGLKSGIIKINYDSLHGQYKNIDTTLYTYTTLSNYCSLFSHIEAQRLNLIESLKWRNKGLEYILDFNKKSGGIKISNIKEEINQAKMVQKLSDQENLIEKAEIRQNWLITSSTIAAILIVALTLLFITNNRNRKKQISILGLEASLKEKELELLKVQNEKQANTVLTSNIAIQKITDLSEVIRNSDLAKNPTMIDIRMNLERLTQVVYKEYNDVLHQDVLDNYSYLREKYSQINELNNTSFKVLVLSILENSPKDIANLLNLNMQYVRNIRSKIKKDLSEELGQNWKWSDLNNKEGEN